MPQLRVHAKDLHKMISGSTRAHHARVSACLDWLSLHGIPAVPISTTGVPIQRLDGGFDLRKNPRQVGISDIMACLPRRIIEAHPTSPCAGMMQRIIVGQLVLIEVKTGNARRTPEQRAQQKRFAAAGALCLVVRDVLDLTALRLDGGLQ